MSYKIQYKPNVKMEKGIRYFLKKHRQSVIYAIGIVICLLIFVRLDITEFIGDFLIPGDADITKAALSDLGSDLKDGVGIKDALTAFCLEIIENAHIAE